MKPDIVNVKHFDIVCAHFDTMVVVFTNCPIEPLRINQVHVELDLQACGAWVGECPKCGRVFMKSGAE